MPTATKRNGAPSQATTKQPTRKAAAARSQSNGGEAGAKGTTVAKQTIAKGSGGSRSAKRGAQTNAQQSRTRGRGQASRSRPKAKATSTGTSSPPRSSSNGSSAARGAHDGNGNAGKTIGVSVATGTLGAAAGIAGGVLLGRTIAQRPRKVLGVKVPRRQPNFTGAASDVARSITAAGQQLGKLAGEVRVAREKAEEIGKVLT